MESFENWLWNFPLHNRLLSHTSVSVLYSAGKPLLKYYNATLIILKDVCNDCWLMKQFGEYDVCKNVQKPVKSYC